MCSLEIEPDKIDVNVHPTKQEVSCVRYRRSFLLLITVVSRSQVHFLNEEEIVENMVAAVGKALSNANASRTFEIQARRLFDRTFTAFSLSQSHRRPCCRVHRIPEPSPTICHPNQLLPTNPLRNTKSG